ncbi:hypothetical protein [Halanaerobacter jeridensis]|uniref:Uncharacterized protein n=1 Tax=Halanaerobacter jeridensis TaxID=706427 RepID=A0A938XV47_9FIRM|nr:hypothetical protein [Halanaerobacter jeridensis]MBM7558108.1 hypothetical protein [Halanaerobacter jeridensis]
MTQNDDEYYKKVIKNSKIRSNLWTSLNGKSIITMRYIFESNYQDIKDKFKEIQDFNNTIERIKDNFLNEQIKKSFIQHLFNFFISAKSFIEHIKRFIEKTKKDVNDSEYLKRYNNVKNKINDFNNGNFANFIRCFRNYIIHEGLPFLNSSVDFKIGENKKGQVEEINNIFLIDISLLIENKAFNKEAKQYLNTLEKREEIDLAFIVDNIYKKNLEIFKLFKFEMMKNQIDKANNKGFFVDGQGGKIK